MVPRLRQQCKRFDLCVEMWSLKFYGLSTARNSLAAKTARSVWPGEKVDRYLFSHAPRMLPCCWQRRRAGPWWRLKKLTLPCLPTDSLSRLLEFATKGGRGKLERQNFYSQSEAFALLGFTGHHLYVI